MALSGRAEGIIRALVTSGINFSQHVNNSDHFDEGSAYLSISSYAKGSDGLGNCSFFDFEENAPQVYRTQKKLTKPAPFTGMDKHDWKLTGGPLSEAKKEHAIAEAKFTYRTRKDDL